MNYFNMTNPKSLTETTSSCCDASAQGLSKLLPSRQFTSCMWNQAQKLRVISRVHRSLAYKMIDNQILHKSLNSPSASACKDFDLPPLTQYSSNIGFGAMITPPRYAIGLPTSESSACFNFIGLNCSSCCRAWELPPPTPPPPPPLT
jgi:hypothetical protein